MDVCLNAAVGKKAKRTVEKNEERKCEKYVCFAMFCYAMGSTSVLCVGRMVQCWMMGGRSV